jgi:hypothetical protein
MFFSKQNYEDQDDGRILKVARKQQYIMFPAPIAFLNDELKAELGMRTKKEESRHIESHCQKMKSGPLWDEQSHLNGQSIYWHLEKNLGDSMI